MSHTDDSRAGVPGVGRARRRPLRGRESRSCCWWRSCLQFVKNTPEKSHGRRRGCVHLFPIRRGFVERHCVPGVGGHRGWPRAGTWASCARLAGLRHALGRGARRVSRRQTGLPCAGEATPRVPRLFRAASHALGLGTPFWPPRAAPWCPLRCPSPSWEVEDPSQRVVPRHRLTPGPTSAPRPASSRDAACSGLLSVACSTLVSVETRTRGGPGEPVDLACGFPGDLL